MKSALKISIMIIASILIILFCMFFYYQISTFNIKLDTNKLISFDRSIVYYDINNNVVLEESNGKAIVNISEIPEYTKNAFISIEDKRFYKHKGVDYQGLFRALLSNIKSFSFKQGASTISQQLIKNTHLSSKKTLKRKLIELKLARELENKYSKENILEKYLNTIYFGENCYGLLSASRHYFDKEPCELSLNESAILASIIKAPKYYSPYQNYQNCFNRKNLVLKEMFSQDLITKTEFDKNINTPIKLAQKNQTNKGFDYFNIASKQLDKVIKNSPYSTKQINVYTYINPQIQDFLEKSINSCEVDAHKSAVILDKNAHVCAYYSTFGLTNRQLGSVIKPLICYAPAIENNLVSSATKILDEKTNFGNYSPRNYNDKYLGNISIKKALATSSNVCAVKLLNYIGVEKAKAYLKKLNIYTTNNDNSLCLALGSTEQGSDLLDITSAYCVFNNKGEYAAPSFIKNITGANNNIIYQNHQENNKVFSDDTISIMNEMMKESVQNGTAKKLKQCKQKLYAKTGTVGNKKGNTDAYTISYNNKYVVGVWFGNKNNKILSNNITGGSFPASISSELWNNLYCMYPDETEIETSDSLQEVYLDKIEYDSTGNLVLADENCPLRYKFKALFKKSMVPKKISTRFTSPTIEKPILSVNNNEISIRLCLTQCVEAKIFRLENGKKIEVFDSSKSKDKIYLDRCMKKNFTYTYIIVPYCNINGKTYFGKEIVLEKIKSPVLETDDWWNI